MTMMKSRKLAAVLLGGTGAFAFTCMVHAQETTSAETLEEIVVTGSRVVSGNNSPTPVTVVQAEDLLAVQPSTIADGLNALPVFAASRNQVANPNPGVGAGNGGNAAANQLNLRNLQPVRTLILMDGHRVPPTSANGIVDVDMVPQFMVKRVDVVTGGASAVYGSDAIAGVVNFVLDRNFNGFKTNVQTGISSRSDGRQYEAGLAFGTQVGVRSHFEASYEFRDDAGVLNRSTRPFARWTLQGNGSTAFPYVMSGDTTISNLSFGGLIVSAANAANTTLAANVGRYFSDTNGTLAAFNPGTNLGGNGNTRIGGDGAYLDGSLKAPLRSHQVFARFDTDLTDTLHGYVQLAGNKKRNELYASWVTINSATFSLRGTNPYLPSSIRQPAGSAATFAFGKILRNGPRQNPVTDEQQHVASLGLAGKLGDAYSWQATYINSSAKLENTINNNTHNLRLAAALDVVTNNAGQPVCNLSLTNAAYANCVPMNVFGPSSESQASLDYVLGTTHYDATTKQDDFSLSMVGAPLSTWAGPINMALSGEWRKQSFESSSDSPATDANNPLDCTGLLLCTAGNRISLGTWATTYVSRSKVQQTVYEGAYEFDAPLLSDVFLAKSLSVNGAVRYTRYDTSGSYPTWKVGIDWHLMDGLRIRGTRSRDIRAPTLDDLFAPSVTGQATVSDTLLAPVIGAANSSYVVPVVQSGNPELEAEKGDTTTVGVVYQPAWAQGLTLSLDAYDIKITDAIVQLPGQTVIYQDSCYRSGGTSPLCNLQVRANGNFAADASNRVVQWKTQTLNLASVHTWGLDFESSYATQLWARPFTLRALVTYQPHLKTKQEASTTLDMGGVAYGPNGTQATPKWRVNLMLRYKPTDSLTLDLMHRWRSSLGLTPDPTAVAIGRVKSAQYTNINVGYRIPVSANPLDLFVNVQNLFDKQPPPANFNGTAGSPGLFGGFPIGDDPIGRYYTVGLKYQF